MQPGTDMLSGETRSQPNTGVMMLRVFIVEDDDLTRENLSEALSAQDDMQVVGSAPIPEEALRALEKVTPDVILVDLGLAQYSGVDLIRELRPKYPALQIMAHTALDDRGAVFEAIKAGAQSYVL